MDSGKILTWASAVPDAPMAWLALLFVAAMSLVLMLLVLSDPWSQRMSIVRMSLAVSILMCCVFLNRLRKTPFMHKPPEWSTPHAAERIEVRPNAAVQESEARAATPAVSDDELDLDTGDDALPQAPSASRICQAGLAGLPVLLHVYDVSKHSGVQAINHVLAHKSLPLRFGGVFHAGVEVGGREYSFGYAPEGTGVTHCKPREHPGHHYRETCDMRRTLLSQREVEDLVRSLAKSYQGPGYHLFRRNCCTFAAELCQQLGAGSLPAWVQRLAHVGDSVLGASEELARATPLSCAEAGQRESLRAVQAPAHADGLRRRTM